MPTAAKPDHLFPVHIEQPGKGDGSPFRLDKFRILYDLAIALTSDHSLSHNLSLIVHKSREILGTDTAYIALVDEEARQVRMHTVCGIQSEAFKKMSLPLGKGLGGLVAQTRRGYIVNNYFDESRMERVVDQVVADEGLLCGLAAPVQMSDQNLGVLYAFNRRPTNFSEEELDTLCLVANLAAVEISRRRVEDSLAEAKQQLEQRVAQRTQSLSRTNRLLSDEVYQRKKVQHALHEEKERFRTLVEQSPWGVSLIDGKGRYLYLNPAFREMFGYTTNEVATGRDWFEAAFPDPVERRRVIKAWKNDFCKAGPGSTYERVFRVTCADGSRKTVHFHRVGLAGDLQLVTYDDISQRKFAEEALTKREAHLRAVFEGSQDCIVTTDAIWRITDFNPAFLAHFGYRAPEVQAAPLGIIFGGGKAFGQWRRESGFSLGYHGSWRGEWQLTHKQGRPLSTEMVVSALFDSEGNPYGFAAVIRDVTGRLKAEAERASLEGQLRQALKMEAIGTLASGIAHDFNNILQGISGYVHLLLSEAEPHNQGSHRLWQIQRSVDRAGDLVRRLLTFGRKMEPKPVSLDLNAEVAQAVDILKRAIPKMIEIHTDLAQDLWPLKGDPNQIQQVLMNLGGNAKDAMADGGRLTVATSNHMVDKPQARSLAGLQPGPHVLLTVSDTGKGIEPAVLPHIFDPFFTTKEVGQGTGLGLSTVYGVVQAHGGHIAAGQAPGGGARFSILLPAQPGALPEPDLPLECPSSPQANCETLLLVDDEAAILESGREMLGLAGFTVHTADCGETALEVFQKRGQQVDVVLLDLGMPGMGGEACLRELVALDPQVRVVITSGYALTDRIRALIKGPRRGFVAKPYRLAGLVAEIRRVMRD